MTRKAKKSKEGEVLKHVRARAEKTAYYNRKAQVLEREKDNDRKIIVFRANKGWWRIIGRSVLFYTKLLAPRIGKQEVKVWADDDYYGRTSREGVVNIRDPEKLKKDAKELGLHITAEDDESFFAIELSQKVTPEDLNIMLNDEERKWALAEKMVMPTVIWTEVKKHIMELMKRTREATRRMDASMQRALGDDMMKVTVEMMVTLNMAAHGQMEEMEALVEMSDKIIEMNGYLMAAGQLRCILGDKMYDLADETNKLKRAVDKEMHDTGKKLAAEEKRRQNEEKQQKDKESKNGAK